MASIYVCLFSNGHIKVGRSVNPRARIASHADRVSCMGVDLTDSATFPVRNAALAERELIERCVERAERRFKNEWFSGLVFSEVVEWAASFATDEEQDEEQDEEPIPDLRPEVSGGIRYTYKDGAWHDRLPHLACWPDSAVMRWDMRKDWHAIWPELVEHPCALYFAPTHPLREGPTSFLAWVRSWPEEYAATRPAEVREFVAAIEALA